MREEPARGLGREAASPARAILVLSGVLLAVAAGIVAYSLTVPPRDAAVVAPAPGLAPAARVAAPGVELPSLRGPERITLGQFRGQVVVLNFFASWCGPCALEAADLERTWQEVRDRGAVFLGVAVQDTVPEARAFLATHRITYPAAFDERGEVLARYRVTGIPTTVVIDPEGRVVARHAGIFVGDEGRAALRALIETARRTR
ncbi:MAG: TlpA disulfide reductase family protein [Armatimonadota bacterium]|nr:TlpA disulfide reductase family protein [Armatimonadota bacterium]MDR7454240.1 TlpA disulfide reductase family protein [Armatimonadota bacterium]MDR7457482.1 TlpA disulfide reductase family protein [Armatimonadota bacterium]MDR7497164.1 TlpA disulfide reductase family protein [Armatimonadota bacterium]